jgi:hypothetical protein
MRSKNILIKVSLTICFLFCYSFANAQLGRGCYVGGLLYTANTSAGNRYFYRTSSISSDCGFERTGNEGNCRLYNSGNINNNNSYTQYGDAFSNDWEEISCPIDGNVWLILISTCAFSIFKLRSTPIKIKA